MTEHRVSIDDGVCLWVASTGSGPPLLLCHGGPGAFDTLEPLAGVIEDIVKVLRWDQRGAGRSDHVGPYTVDRFVADIEGLREHFGYQRWTVAGHSWGANLALAYAQSHPSRVDGVIYLAGTGLEWWPHYRRLYAAERDRRLGPERTRRLAELAERDRTDEEEYEYRYLSTLVEFADRERAEHLAKQVVDCVGDVRPVEATDSLVDALSTVRRVGLKTGHYPWIERPSELRAVLRDFLSPEDRPHPRHPPSAS